MLYNYMTHAVKYLLALILTFSANLSAYAGGQTAMSAPDTDSEIKVGSGRVKPLQGYYIFKDEEGMTC